MSRSTRAASAALILLLTTTALAEVRKGTVPGVTNFSRVDATVGCGGATEPGALAALRDEGFVSVVNLRLASEDGAEIIASRAAAERAGLKYVHLPLDGANPDAQLVDAFLAAIADPGLRPMYIHCATANRVGAVWMVKRVLQDGWPLEKAEEEAEAIGLTSPRLKEFARAYIEARRR